MICRFRNLAAQAGLGERLFALLEEKLDGKGKIVRRSSLIDAPLMSDNYNSRLTTIKIPVCL